MNFNIYIFNLLHNLAGKWWPLDWFFIFFGSYVGYILVILAVVLIIKLSTSKQRLFFFLFIILSLLLSRGVIGESFKRLYPVDRPFVTYHFTPLISESLHDSFPSGHALLYFALATCIFFMNKKAGWWAFGIAVVMGIGRVFVGVHYPVDVLVGAVLGIGSTFVVARLLEVPHRPQMVIQ